MKSLQFEHQFHRDFTSDSINAILNMKGKHEEDCDSELSILRNINCIKSQLVQSDIGLEFPHLSQLSINCQRVAMDAPEDYSDSMEEKYN